MGLINRTIKLDVLSDYTANVLKEKIAQELKVKSIDVVLKIGGKQLGEDDVVSNGAKLLSIIKPPTVKPAAPSPISESPPSKCIGWKRTCQFFTSGSCEYCSLCEKRRQRETSESKLTPAIVISDNTVPIEEVPSRLQSDESKCWLCTKYVGLLGFSCRCGFKYCALHRYPETHHCNFDHKQHNKRKLEEELLGGLCGTNKVSKI